MIQRITIIILLVSAVSYSCEEVDQPMTRDFTEASFWKTEEDALKALASCYENMFNANYFFGDNALSDDAYVKANDFSGVALIANGGYDGGNDRIAGQWAYHYWAIRKCNVFLENVDRVGMDEETTNRMKAEARFIRAFAHFQLATWYGDVPLVRDVLSLSDARSITRTPHTEVISFVLSELADIQQFLPPSYPEMDRGRIRRAAAIALHARVNLYEGNWQAVIADCERIMHSDENGTFALHPSYENLFTVGAEYNNEVILDLQYGGPRLYSEQRLFLPGTVGKLRANLVPTQSLVDSYITLDGKPIDDPESGYDLDAPYENRDPRLLATIIYHGSTIVDFEGETQTILTQPGSTPPDNTIEDQAASATGYYFRKYYDPTAVIFNSGLNLILIRYADVLLMYAEAKNEVGEMSAEVWNETVRLIRARAGFTENQALDFDESLGQEGWRDVIRRERRSELAFEGLHAFDIRRWGTADEVLNGPVRGIRVPSGQFPSDQNGYIIVAERLFQPKHYRWPIPQQEIDQNPNLLPNNEGW